VPPRAPAGHYRYRLDTYPAPAKVQPESAAPGTELEKDNHGRRHPVTIISESPYDPENERLKS
jgi:dimethylglycine dehydrogenase